MLRRVSSTPNNQAGDSRGFRVTFRPNSQHFSDADGEFVLAMSALPGHDVFAPRAGGKRQAGGAPAPAGLKLRFRSGSVESDLEGSCYFRCFPTSLVISNILTADLPPNTVLRAASALIIRRFFLSCRSFFLM